MRKCTALSICIIGVLLALSCQNINITEDSSAETPTFDANDGTYFAPKTITISSSTADAKIRYTLDGTAPSKTAGTLYEAPLVLVDTGTTTIKAVAYTDSLLASGIAVATYKIVPVIIQAPETVTASPANASVSLAWTTVDGATGYNIYYKAGTTAAKTDTKAAGNPYSASPATITGLINGTAYAFIVTALDAVNESEASEVATATPSLVVLPPAAPVLSALTRESGKTTATWSAVSGAAKYTLYYKLGTTVSKTDYGQVFPDLPGASTSYLISPLTNGSEYAFIVTASNAGGESDASNIMTVKPGVTPIPTGVSAANVGAFSVSVTWTPVDGATGYNIYYKAGTTVTKADSKAGGNPYTAPPATISNLDTGITYAFIVTAIDAYGESEASEVDTATPSLTVLPPAAPVLAPMSREVGKTTASWTLVSGATKYTLYYKAGTSVSKTSYDQVFPDIPSTATSYLVSPLTNASEYAFIMTASNSGGESEASNIATVKPGIPGVPTGVSATALGPTSVQITWTAPVGAVTITDYKIYRSGTSGDTNPTLIVGGISGSSYNDTGLTMGSNYYYWVKASSADGNSEFSAQASATTPTGSPPLVPTSFAASAGDTAVTLSWTAPATGDPATSYKIYYKAGATVTTASLDTATSTASPKTITGLTNDLQYAFIVAGVNEFGEGTATSIITATPGTVPGAPGTPTVSSFGDGTVTLAWTAPTTGSAVASYKIYYKQGATVAKTDPLSTPSATSPKAIEGLSNDLQYAFIVTGVNAYGEGAASGIVTATPIAPVGIPNAIAAADPRLKKIAVTIDAPTSGGTVASYKIYCGGTLIGTSTSAGIYADTRSALVAGTSYSYTVSAVNALGEGTQSSPSSATGTVPPTPTITVDMSKTGRGFTNNFVCYSMKPNSIHISTTNATGSHVTGNRSGFTATDVFNAVGVYSNSADFTGPLGLIYPNMSIIMVWSGHTFNEWGDSPPTTYNYTFVDADQVNSTDLSSTKTANSITVTWTAPAGVVLADRYALYTRTLATDPWTLYQTYSAADYRIFSGLANGTYYYAVVAYNTTNTIAGNMATITVTLP